MQNPNRIVSAVICLSRTEPVRRGSRVVSGCTVEAAAGDSAGETQTIFRSDSKRQEILEYGAAVKAALYPAFHMFEETFCFRRGAGVREYRKYPCAINRTENGTLLPAAGEKAASRAAQTVLRNGAAKLQVLKTPAAAAGGIQLRSRICGGLCGVKNCRKLFRNNREYRGRTGELLCGFCISVGEEPED